MIGLFSSDRPEYDPNAKIVVSTAVNSRFRYGSTETMSTELFTASSSSSLSQESLITPPDHGLSLDLTSIDVSEDRVLLTTTGHSRGSSYSDISEEGGYYDRAARHGQRAKEACNIIESTFTLSNFKLIFSIIIWFVSYMIMGMFGGTVAYMHFKRSDWDVPDPLPDYGYDVIPVSKIRVFLAN